MGSWHWAMEALSIPSHYQFQGGMAEKKVHILHIHAIIEG